MTAVPGRPCACWGAFCSAGGSGPPAALPTPWRAWAALRSFGHWPLPTLRAGWPWRTWGTMSGGDIVFPVWERWLPGRKGPIPPTRASPEPGGMHPASPPAPCSSTPKTHDGAAETESRRGPVPHPPHPLTGPPAAILRGDWCVGLGPVFPGSRGRPPTPSPAALNRGYKGKGSSPKGPQWGTVGDGQRTGVPGPPPQPWPGTTGLADPSASAAGAWGLRPGTPQSCATSVCPFSKQSGASFAQPAGPRFLGSGRGGPVPPARLPRGGGLPDWQRPPVGAHIGSLGGGPWALVGLSRSLLSSVAPGSAGARGLP